MQLLDELNMYMTSDEIEEIDMSVDGIISDLAAENSDGCDFIIFLENETTGDVYIDVNSEN